MLCTEIVSDIQNNFLHNMFSPCSAKRRASDKDLPVTTNIQKWVKFLKNHIKQKKIEADFAK